MKFGEYLKAARTRKEYTQEYVAEKLGITTKTLQNWEKDIQPNKDYWNDILNLYELNQNEFISNYTNEIFENKTNHRNFPSIICKIFEQLESINLTDAEQKLYGLLNIYQDIEHLPYSYIKDREFEVLNTFDTLNEKLKNEKIIELFDENYTISSTDINNLILNKLKKNSRNLFNVWDLSKEEIVELLKKVKKESKSSSKNIFKSVESLISIFDKDIDEKIFVGKLRESSYHFSKNEIQCDYENEKLYRNISDYIPFINIIDEESIDEEYQDKMREYNEKCEKYQEILEDYWKYPGKYNNREPKEPDKPYYQGYRYLTLKEETKELIKWLNKE